MIRSHRNRVLIAIVAVLALVAAVFPAPVHSQSRVGVSHGHTLVNRGVYGWPRYGFGWGSYFSPVCDSGDGPY